MDSTKLPLRKWFPSVPTPNPSSKRSRSIVNQEPSPISVQHGSGHRLPGLGGAHLLQGASNAAMTNEQRIRGADQGFDSAIIVAGYSPAAVSAIAGRLVGAGGLFDNEAVEIAHAVYGMGYSLLSTEIIPGQASPDAPRRAS